MWILEFYAVNTGEAFTSGTEFKNFLKAKDEVKNNFLGYTFNYVTKGPWQDVIPVREDNNEASNVGARIRNFPTYEHYEFYKGIRALIPGAEPFVSDRIERFQPVGLIADDLGTLINSQFLIDKDDFGL